MAKLNPTSGFCLSPDDNIMTPQAEFTSSMKKVVIPKLNFEKVYEQQRLILEHEDRRKKEEEKK